MTNSIIKNCEDHLGFRVSYKGKNFRGFQAQAHSNSVQQVIENALSILLRTSIRIQFTSRTDSGVHAYDQLILVPDGWPLFENLKPLEKKRFLISLNSLLGGEICAWDLLRLKQSFHPKKDVLWKEYHYQITQGLSFDPLLKESAWAIRSPLNLEAMLRALKLMKGTHDFTGFASKHRMTDPEVDNVRTILDASIMLKGHPWISRLHYYTFRFRGDGFLYRMVRNMVGALVQVGRGEDVDISRILKTKQRPSEVLSAPAQGLVLAKTKIPSRFFVKIVGFAFFMMMCLADQAVLAASDFSGSASFAVHQRFFDDARLANVNGFSNWGALEIRAVFGIYEFSYGFEPVIGFGFMKNSASLYKLDDAGNYILDSNGNKIKSELDSLEYQIYTLSYGVRWKAWSPNFFFIIPYGEALQDFRYGRVQKITQAVNQQKVNTGFDLGLELAGGLLVSFMYDQARQNDLRSQWDLKDFALLTSIQYLPGGFFRQGLGLIDTTGGWSFGAGLFMDW